MVIGIIGALDDEITYFQQRMSDWERVSAGGQTFYQGDWNGLSAVIVKCGVGKVNAAMTTQKLIDHFQVEKIIFTGVAGAVNPDLETGDVVVSADCQQHDLDASPLGFPKGTIPMYEGPSIFQADHRLINAACSSAEAVKAPAVKVIQGKVVSGDQFIADKQQVNDLRTAFAADCVEMEGAAVAHVAQFNGVAFVIIRSISDKANGDAPDDFMSFMSQSAALSASIVEKMMTLIKNGE